MSHLCRTTWVPNISQPHKLGSTWPYLPWREPTTSFILSSFSGLKATCDWLGLNNRNFKTSRRFFRELTSQLSSQMPKNSVLLRFSADCLGTSWYEYLRIEPGLLHNLPSHCRPKKTCWVPCVSRRAAMTPRLADVNPKDVICKSLCFFFRGVQRFALTHWAV